MKIKSTKANYIVNGLNLNINQEIDVPEEDSIYILSLPGVIQIEKEHESELLIEQKTKTSKKTS